jgi:hypothetical protein
LLKKPSGKIFRDTVPLININLRKYAAKRTVSSDYICPKVGWLNNLSMICHAMLDYKKNFNSSLLFLALKS